MIITKEDFFEMGFTADKEHEKLIDGCIKRAEFVINGISGGRASAIALGNGTAAELVKQAAAFQANALLKEEIACAKAVNSSESGGESSSSKTEERVSIGDFSYSSGTAEGSSTKTSSSSKSENEFIKPLDTEKTVVKLLRAAGCFYSAAEVIE